MGSNNGWNCQGCTYHHQFPAPRCVMCGELRVTKQQMREFVLGKTLKPAAASETAINSTTSAVRGGIESFQKPAPAAKPPAVRPTSSGSRCSIRNPYAKSKQRAASGPAATHVNQQKPAAPSASRPLTVAATATVGQSKPASTAVRPQSSLKTYPPVQNPFPVNTAMPATWENQQNTDTRNNYAAFPQVGRASIAQQNPRPPPPQNNTVRVSSLNNAQATKQPPMQRQLPNKNPFSIAAKKPVPQHYVPGPIPLDPETASVWIYPVNKDYPVRGYQLQMSETAICNNTIVSLPTGLGKTLVAAVVLYNFYRWFPSGKVVFLAPTLPLVNQQVTACYDIMGIPEKDTAILTGKVGACARATLWKERRVFFCTPQTVHKDIVAERCAAKSIVCLVLDEAHRASGEYAYTKVVHQIEQAGAKYRLLGLSATPGTDIMSIQKVIDTLRISKIEVRLEDDPDVKKYIYERHHEMIVVKQVSVVNTCERLLNDLISPLLNRLRDSNGLGRLGGNATITPYNLIKAQQEYKHRSNGDQSMDGHFFAAQTFVRIRSELRNYGIGVTRISLRKLKANSRGLVSTLVKGKEFQAVWDAVMGASSSPGKESAENRKLNNPKLMKLDEILTEHFERARACSESSRAIVFSNGRESVNEIVDVLSASQPLLRPRHFVGQSKTTGGKSGTSSMAGMRQKEQQQVIGEFRTGTHNVLVCTCVAEEGLDVGEVDLIVMFDSLQSPTRMIQRSGRTGRKRNGRVVYLVSEGQEEKKLKSSNLAQKTLGRALKNPDKFKTARNQPMFPQKPTLEQREMSIDTAFRLSQVGGHERTERTRNVSNKREPAVGSGAWKLSAEQEEERAKRFGTVGDSRDDTEGSSASFPQALRRIIIRARTRGTGVQKRPSLEKYNSVGVTRTIIREMERSWGREAPTCQSTPGKGSRVRSFNSTYRGRGVSALYDKELFASLFPSEKVNEERKNVFGEANGTAKCGIGGYEPDSDSLGLDDDPDPHAMLAFEEFRDEPRNNENIAEERPPSDEFANVVAPAVAASTHGEAEKEKCSIPDEIVISSEVVDDIHVEPGEFCLPTPPDSTASSGSEDSDEDEEDQAQTTTSSRIAIPTAKTVPEIDQSSNHRGGAPNLESTSAASQCRPTGNDSRITTGAVAAFDARQQIPPSTGDEREKAQELVVAAIDTDDQRGIESDEKASQSQFLCLPTQESSSSEDDSSIESSQSSNDVHQKPAKLESLVDNEPKHDSAEQVNILEKDGGFQIEATLGTICSNAENPVAHVDGNGIQNIEESSIGKALNPATEEDSRKVDKETFREGSMGMQKPEPILQTDDLSQYQSKKDNVPEDHDSRIDEANKETMKPDTFSDKNDKATGACYALQQLSRDVSEQKTGSSSGRCSVPAAAASSLEDDTDNLNVIMKPRTGKRRRDVLLTQETPVFQSAKTPEMDNRSMEGGLVDTPISTTDIKAHTSHHIHFSGVKCKKQGECDGMDRKTRQRRRQIPSRSMDTPTPQSSSKTEDFHLVDTPEDTQMVIQSTTCEPRAPDDVDDVVCAVCHAGHSTDDDPIVLCDGPENDYSCKTAVHKSCYQVTVPLDDEESWRCDPCEIKRKRTLCASSNSFSVHEVSCNVCLTSGGVFWHRSTPDLKEVWVHPTCRQWAVGDMGMTCDFCRRKGAVPCAAEACNRAAHPHCAINAITLRRQWSLIQISHHNDVSKTATSALRLMFCGKDERNAREVLTQSGMDCTSIERLPKCVFFKSKDQQDDKTASNCMKTTATDGNETSKPVAKRKRLRKKTSFEVVESDVSNTSESAQNLVGAKTEDALNNDGNEEENSQAAKRRRVQKRIEERKRALHGCKFIDSEAGIDSDEDVDGDCTEEAEALRIEEEELSHSSFINDTSQLGYTQDELARVDSEGTDQICAQNEGTFLHRIVDIETHRKNLFATPVLNRRMWRKTPGGEHSAWNAPTPHSAPSSQKGLGNMHFIRSVLEHHRQGGQADEIEELYNKVAQDCSESQEGETQEQPRETKILTKYVASASEESEEKKKPTAYSTSNVVRAVSDEDDSLPKMIAKAASNVMKENQDPRTRTHLVVQPSKETRPILTAEQKAMIEAKRQEALQRRRQHLAVQAAKKR